jgi:uncharacterized protein DUF4058
MMFPGMDPYLEAPFLWPDVHSRLIVYVAEQLRPLIRPRYIASVQTRIFIEGPNQERIPDVGPRRVHASAPSSTAVLDADAPVEVQVTDLEVQETYLEIIDLQTKQRVVTVLEVVSPTNKYSGPGRESYLAKQAEVRRSEAHLVEIDLLRTGPHVLAVPEHLARGLGSYDYLICVNRAEGQRTKFQLYLRTLSQRLPRLRCPLAPGDDDVVLDLQAALERTYEAGGYEDLIRCDQPCVPPLPPQE